MNRKYIIGLCGAGLLSASLFGAWAQAGDYGPRCGGWKGDQSGMHWGGRMIKKLDLNEEQAALVNAQRKNAKDSQAGRKETRMQMHKELHSLITAENFQEERLEELASSMAENMKAGIVLQGKAMRELYITLNEEQKEKLQEMHEKRSKHKGKH